MLGHLPRGPSSQGTSQPFSHTEGRRVLEAGQPLHGEGSGGPARSPQGLTGRCPWAFGPADLAPAQAGPQVTGTQEGGQVEASQATWSPGSPAVFLGPVGSGEDGLFPAHRRLSWPKDA